MDLRQLIHGKQIPLKALIALCAVMLAGILILGLNPRHSLSANRVMRLAEAPGIRFQKYGIAHTLPFNSPILGDPAEQKGFSLEIAFTSHHRWKNGFGVIFLFHDREDGSQLLMGQWQDSIIVMKGDDYGNRKRQPRIRGNMAEVPSETIVATVTTGIDGTRLYLNGRFILKKKYLRFEIPDGDRHARLVLGNSVYGNSTWEGSIHGFAVYPNRLTAADVSENYNNWLENHSFSFAMEEGPSLLYLFDEVGGRGALDRSNGNNHLHIPSRMTVLKKRMLAFSLEKFYFHSRFIQDIIINFLGFMPFGFILASIHYRCTGPCQKYAITIAVIMGFSVSLSIEVAQSWIPSRSSSLLDLVLNTAGTGLGAVVREMVFRKLRI